MRHTTQKNRLISSASISYKITDKLKFKLSGGADITEFSFEDFAPISTPSHESCYLKTQTNSNRTINADAVLTYSTNLGKNMSLVGTAGLNLYRVDNFQTTITGKDKMCIRDSLVPAGSKHRIDEPGVETVRGGRNPEPDVRQPDVYKRQTPHRSERTTFG